MKIEKIVKFLCYLSISAMAYFFGWQIAALSGTIAISMYYVGLKEEKRKTDAIYKIAIGMQKKSSPQSGAI